VKSQDEAGRQESANFGAGVAASEPAAMDDGLSQAVKDAEVAAANSLAEKAEKLDAVSLQQLAVGNGVAFDLPQEAAPAVLNYVQNSRAPVAQYGGGPSRQRSINRGQPQQTPAGENRSGGVRRVLVIMQSAGGGGSQQSLQKFAAPAPSAPDPSADGAHPAAEPSQP
jgi:hypothetical protein